MSDPLSLNLYTYVTNNPIKYYDPSGYEAVRIKADFYSGEVELDTERLPELFGSLTTVVELFNGKVEWNNITRRATASFYNEEGAKTIKAKFGLTECHLGLDVMRGVAIRTKANQLYTRYPEWEWVQTQREGMETKDIIEYYVKNGHIYVNIEELAYSLFGISKEEISVGNINQVTTSTPTVTQGTGNPGEMTISEQGLKTIADFELSEAIIKAWGLGAYDANGNIIGIYPHYVFKKTVNGWVSDGGITFGYGHYVDQSEYNIIASERALVDTYAKGAPILPLKTPSNGVAYSVPGSSYVPIEEAMRLFREDISGSQSAVNSFLKTHNISLKQHQFDMLVSFTHNYGNGWWTKTPEKVLPKFIREGKGNYNPNDVIRVFEMHDNKERRKQEAEIFNNGYNI